MRTASRLEPGHYAISAIPNMGMTSTASAWFHAGTGRGRRRKIPYPYLHSRPDFVHPKATCAAPKDRGAVPNSSTANRKFASNEAALMGDRVRYATAWCSAS